MEHVTHTCTKTAHSHCLAESRIHVLLFSFDLSQYCQNRSGSHRHNLSDAEVLSYIFCNFLAVLPKIQSQRVDGLHSIVSFQILFERHSHSRFFPPPFSFPMWTCRSLCEAGASPPYSKFCVFSNRKKRHNNGNNTFSHIFIRRILQLSWILLIFTLCRCPSVRPSQIVSTLYFVNHFRCFILFDR